MMEEFHKSGEHHTGWWERFRAWAFKFLRSSARYWWIPFFTTAAGLAVASWVIFQQHVVYVSSGRMMVSGRINLQQGAVFSEELANFFGTQTELMKSSEVRMKAVNLLASTDPRLEPVPTDLAVSQLPQTSIFVLSTTGPDAQYVQKFLDAIMTEYIATKKEMRSSKTEDTQAAIVEEIARVEHEMQQSEQDLLNFQKANNVGYLEQEGNSAGVYLANLNRQLADLKTQYQLFSTMDLDEIIAKTQNDPGHAGNLAARSADVEYQGLLGTGIQPEDQYLEARQQLAVLKSQRDALAKTFRPKHPKMVDIADKISQQELLIATLRQQSLDRFKTMRDSIKGQIDNLTKAIGEWDKKALSLSERLADYNQLKANFERTKSLYDRLVNNLHDVDITRNVDQDLISILEKASPAQPIKPGSERVLTIGICVGLLVGLSAIFFLDYIDDRFSSPADVQSRLDEHLLGHVPSLKQKGTLAPLRENDPRHAFAESLRGLRSSLLFLPFEGQRPKTILITSAVPDEGKSTIALNLAITMAFAKVRVLIVDGDLRRGSLHKLLDRRMIPGLSELLQEQATVDECIVPTSIPGLDLIPLGKETKNPGELLLGAHLEHVLRKIYGLYEYIIFDSSPIMAADDSTSLAPKLDATIFVVRFAHSPAKVAMRALELLRDRQANVIGVVCNDVSEVYGEYYQYKYSQYYGSQQSAV